MEARKAGRRSGPGRDADSAGGRGDAADGPGLESALKRLEEIARRLEEGDLDLQASLALYREARELHSYCARLLSAADEELQLLLSNDRVVAESEAPHAAERDED